MIFVPIFQSASLTRASFFFLVHLPSLSRLLLFFSSLFPSALQFHIDGVFLDRLVAYRIPRVLVKLPPHFHATFLFSLFFFLLQNYFSVLANKIL